MSIIVGSMIISQHLRMQQIVCCLLNKLKDQGQWSTAAKTYVSTVSM